MKEQASMPAVDVVKASAGSGKTYRLTQEFLSRILDDGTPWREVLAVTFTNKATAEMKGRIVAALERESGNEGKRGAKACAVLRDILRHYGSLHVGTIDAYLQGAAAVEDGGRRVDLDEEAVLRDTVERVMEDAGRDATLMRRLKTLVRKQVEDGRGWDVRASVFDMARRFLEEPFLLALLEEGSVVTDPAAVDALAARTRQETAAFERRLRRLGRAALDAMAAEGHVPEDYKGKSRGPMMAFYRWAEGTVKEPGARFPGCADETEGQGVQQYVLQALDLFGEPYREYRTAKILADSIPYLALWSAIWSALGAVLDRDGTTLLRRSAARLAAARQDDEAYIELHGGSAVGAMLVDEAQDTSVLQWANLRRIARETLRRGGRVLAVGDVKQSIYRWRGADWRLLSGGMQASMPETAFTEDTLKENWRSSRAVVAMNNTLFGNLAANIGQTAPAEAAAALAKAYGDAVQAVPAAHEGGDAGYARVEALDGDDWAARALERCVEDILRCHGQGYAWREITVLVRKNSEGGTVARRLLEAGIPVVTEDGLRAGSNACVQRAAAALRLAHDPDDDVARLLCDGRAAAPAGSLYETAVAAIRDARPGEGDMAYVQVLADQAMAYQQREGSDMAGFLAWWEDTGSRKSVGGGDGRDAVRVMTIHKAKGLSLECVIVPFAGEKILPPTPLTPTIWTRPRGTFADAGLVPVKAYEKTLSGTGFEEAMREERSMQWLDVVNTFYVATTRACSRLYVYMPADDPSKSPSRVSSIVQRTTPMPGGILETGEETPHATPEAHALTAPMTDVTEGGHTPVAIILTADEYFSGKGLDVEF